MPAPESLLSAPQQMTPDRTKAARELLAFYLEAGADALLGEEPVDRFAGEEAAPSVAAPAVEAPAPGPAIAPRPRVSTERPAAPPPQAAPAFPDVAITDARTQARAAASLEELRRILAGFGAASSSGTPSSWCSPTAGKQARVMFVGEAPGRDEDQEGLPFVGRSGKLLDLMLKAIGLDRTSVYIANVIPWRPPGNRTPTPQETQICLPFIRRQIELADPDVLVCLGDPSSQTPARLHRRHHEVARPLARPTGPARGEIRAIATLHPAYLLRQPLQKRLAWRDFLAVKKAPRRVGNRACSWSLAAWAKSRRTRLPTRIAHDARGFCPPYGISIPFFLIDCTPVGLCISRITSRAADWLADCADTAAVKVIQDWISSGSGPTNSAPGTDIMFGMTMRPSST